MSELTLPKKVKVSDNVLFQEIDNEYVLLNMETEQYFGLNEIGAKLWHSIAEYGDVDNALEQIMKAYDVAEDTLKKDISSLLTELSNEQLVTFED